MDNKPLEEATREAQEKKMAEQITWVPLTQPTRAPALEPKTGPMPLVQWHPAEAPEHKW